LREKIPIDIKDSICQVNRQHADGVSKYKFGA